MLRFNNVARLTNWKVPEMKTSENSEEMLMFSLYTLLNEQSFESISVNDILNRCGLSRTTFYRHFEDKYDLAWWFFLRFANELLKMMPNFSQKDSVYRYTQIANHFKSNSDFYKKIINVEGQNSFFNLYYSNSVNATTKQLKQQIGKAVSDDMLFETQFYVTGAVYMTKDWINSGFKESPEELARKKIRCIPAEIRQYIL